MVDRIELPASLAEVTGAEATRLMEEIRQNRAIVDSHAHFTKTPYLPYFTGEQKGCDFKLWKSAVESIQKSHHSTSVTEAIRKSLQGPASKILSNLPFDAPVPDIVSALQTDYGEVKDPAASWQQFYGATQHSKEDVCAWHTRLQAILCNIPVLRRRMLTTI